MTKTEDQDKELYQYLKDNKQAVQSLTQKWNTYWNYEYPLEKHTPILSTRRMLILESFSEHNVKLPDRFLDLLYIRDKLDLSKYSIASQIRVLMYFVDRLESGFYDTPQNLDLKHDISILLTLEPTKEYHLVNDTRWNLLSQERDNINKQLYNMALKINRTHSQFQTEIEKIRKHCEEEAFENAAELWSQKTFIQKLL